MCRSATDGDEHLATLVRQAADLCRAAQDQLPARTGPGRPPDFETWQLAVLILVAIARRRKSKSGQHAFLVRHRTLLLGGPVGRPLGLDKLPCRSTFMERYPESYAVYEKAIEIQGRRALAQHACCARVVAVDKSIVAARGPAYHRRLQRADRRLGRRPRAGTDAQAAWGYGPHDGWVWGYSYEVVVCATKNRVVFPLLASAGTASCNEHTSFPAKVPRLPASVRYVLADGGYDGNDIAEAVERRPRRRRRRPPRRGRPPGPCRRFVCPLQSRCGKPAVGRVAHRGTRERRRQHRAARDRFYRSVRGKRLYRQRSRTVEPFNQWFKHLFDLEDRVWHRGLGNNRAALLAAVFLYQLLLRHSFRCGRRDGQVQWILDAL